MPFLLKNYSLVEVVYLFIKCNKTKFLPWNTDNTDRNVVNKQKGHTKHLQKDNIGKGRGGSNYQPGCFWIFFQEKSKKKQVMTSTLFWTRDLSSNRNKLGFFSFFEKILHTNKLKIKKVLNVPELF